MYWVGGSFAVLLLVYADRYGYHRDELYFLAAGRRPDWGYPDQPPVVPLLARAMSFLDADSLTLLRLPAIAAAVLVVLCAGWLAREFGGGRLARTLAAATVASAALLMGAGHLLGTTIFDLAVLSLIVLLVLRLLRPETDRRWWLAIGALVGLGLQVKALTAIPLLLLALAFAVVGPRKIFATRYFPLAVGLATLIVLPYLVWQARNGWPQWELSRAIAGGSSGTSGSRAEFVLLQCGLMGPLLVPLWIFGLWWLWRHRDYRAFALTYLLLFATYLATGGKAYYLGGMYPLLLAAAATGLEPGLAGRRIRLAAVGSVVTVNAVFGALLFLPVLPETELRGSPVVEINYDAGETIGWPEYVRQLADARARVAPDAEILTANYGEAGAVERFGSEYRLPAPHSPHNSYWWWGPPVDNRPVLVVGMDEPRIALFCKDFKLVVHLRNEFDIHADEHDAPVYLCSQPKDSWAELWPGLRRLG
ncbi:glycosyltransferase family 39 protein [Nocardia yamanashiensis]|uniref:glycosyltransferase family 39 protein n=1 Tax=Nocardia yamanashiensis TaxID=209247 RepID=UPI00082E104C|nr:glycosyltransferase family 39 protein [Nocardia yamanashiensis]